MPLGAYNDGDTIANYTVVFVAQLTAVDTSGAFPVYTAIEQRPLATGTYGVADIPRTFQCREINDALVEVVTLPLVQARFRCMVESQEVYEFDAGSGGGEGGGGGAGGKGGCGLASLQTTDCLSAIGPFGSVMLYYDSGSGHWLSVDELTYDESGSAPLSGLVEFWWDGAGMFHLAIGAAGSPSMRELASCGDGCWRGGPLTGHLVGTWV